MVLYRKYNNVSLYIRTCGKQGMFTHGQSYTHLCGLLLFVKHILLYTNIFLFYFLVQEGSLSNGMSFIQVVTDIKLSTCSVFHHMNLVLYRFNIQLLYPLIYIFFWTLYWSSIFSVICRPYITILPYWRNSPVALGVEGFSEILISQRNTPIEQSLIIACAPALVFDTLVCSIGWSTHY